jgi:hypothetical protein
MKQNAALRTLLVLAMLFGGFALVPNAAAQNKGKPVPPPQENISSKKHPNLAAAQKHLDTAFEKIQAAQQANEFDLEGHAAKAKELIDQASKELKIAAEAANKEHK